MPCKSVDAWHSITVVLNDQESKRAIACSRQGLRIRLGEPTFLSGWISYPKKGTHYQSVTKRAALGNKKRCSGVPDIAFLLFRF
jgi:hypothetical protein